MRLLITIDHRANLDGFMQVEVFMAPLKCRLWSDKALSTKAAICAQTKGIDNLKPNLIPMMVFMKPSVAARAFRALEGRRGHAGPCYGEYPPAATLHEIPTIINRSRMEREPSSPGSDLWRWAVANG